MTTTTAKMWNLFASIFCFLLLNSCANNTNPPEYVKDVVAYKEGDDGIVVYFVLADASGQMTTATGTYDLVISQEVSHYSDGSSYNEKIQLLSSRREASLSDFKNTEVGMGAFAHKAVLYPVGRIRYSDFSTSPRDHGTGTVEIRFRIDGNAPISGSTTFSL